MKTTSREILPRPEWGPRFWKFVVKGPDCWEWAGANSGSRKPGFKPYGIFAVSKSRKEKAHRISWAITHGPIPAGLKILHQCDNPSCVRPDHLFSGTQKDNVQDCIRKGRKNAAIGMDHGLVKNPDRRARGDRNGSRIHPERLRRAETHPNRKLDWNQVREIRRLFLTGRSIHSLSRQFPVARHTIKLIIHGKAWKENNLK